MNPVSVASLASLFKIGGALVGLPSIVVLVLYGLHTLRRRLATPTPEANFGENPDGVLLVLQGMTKVIGTAAEVAGSIAQIVFDAATIAAGAGLVLAIVCWVTGRGLQVDATWARVSASLVLLLATLVALVLALSLRGVARLPMFALVVFGAMALHALWGGARPALT